MCLENEANTFTALYGETLLPIVLKYIRISEEKNSFHILIPSFEFYPSNGIVTGPTSKPGSVTNIRDTAKVPVHEIYGMATYLLGDFPL